MGNDLAVTDQSWAATARLCCYRRPGSCQRANDDARDLRKRVDFLAKRGDSFESLGTRPRETLVDLPVKPAREPP
jgi:hypothetical protein